MRKSTKLAALIAVMALMATACTGSGNGNNNNNGSKTGAVLGCTMQINVPMATPVSDDNSDQGPLRIALGGTITAVGVMTGTPETSSLVMVQDAQMVRRRFVWTAVRP